MAKRKIERRKPSAQRKETYLRVRVTDGLDRAIRQAASRKQISVSAWITDKLVDAVRADGVDV